MSTADFDFSYIDHLPQKSAGQGRVFFGAAAQEFNDDRAAILFVHGGYHGAWCFANYLKYFDAANIPTAAMDMRGHGGLPQTHDLHLQGVRDMAQDVASACAALARPAIVVGHSAGALVAAAAGETTSLCGLGLLAPSPPGQLDGLHPLPLVPTGGLVAPPNDDICQHKFLGGGPVLDIRKFTQRLCLESPQMLNDRYALRIHIDQAAFNIPTICIAAGRDLGTLHPEGQDQATARFFGAEYDLLDDAPHCMMLSTDWRDSAALIEAWYRRHF